MATKFTALTMVASAATFAAVWIATAPAASVQPSAALPPPDVAPVAPLVVPPRPSFVRPSVPRPRRSAGIARVRPVAAVHYAGCEAVRAAGRAPLYAGEPGYDVGMDGDRDGIACEPRRY